MLKSGNRTIKKSLTTVMIIGFMMLMVTSNTYAHSGRTDGSGGHRDNKNKSGLGSYHYHHGMGPHLHPNGVCPYAPQVKPVAVPTLAPAPTPAKIATDSVKIASADKKLAVGENKTFIATVSPDNATNKSITWSSSDSSVATISSTGAVTAKGSGITTITAKTIDGKTNSISLTVNKDVENILINEKDISLEVDETKTLSATISPEDAINKSISWLSSDPNVATISESGVVLAKNPGTTTITAKAYNGKTNSITITVTENAVPALSSKTMETNYSTSTLESEKTKTPYIISGLGLLGAVYGFNYFKKKSKK